LLCFATAPASFGSSGGGLFVEETAMKAYLVSTRGRRPFQYTVILVASAKPGLESFRCNLLSDPLALLTRLGSVEIVVAKESDRAQIEAFEEHQDIDAFLAWLDAGTQRGRGIQAGA
jgi:hypothetical protein